MLHWR